WSAVGVTSEPAGAPSTTTVGYAATMRHGPGNGTEISSVACWSPGSTSLTSHVSAATGSARGTIISPMGQLRAASSSRAAVRAAIRPQRGQLSPAGSGRCCASVAGGQVHGQAEDAHDEREVDGGRRCDRATGRGHERNRHDQGPLEPRPRDELAVRLPVAPPEVALRDAVAVLGGRLAIGAQVALGARLRKQVDDSQLLIA